MTVLLEFREKFFQIVGKRERLILAAVKFVIAFFAFFFINRMVGYMDQISDPLIWIGLAAICAFTPCAVTLLIGAALILANFYVLSMELSVIALLLFVLMFCLYFRFVRGSGLYAVLAALLCASRIPFVMPNVLGMLTKPYKVFSIVFGTMVYFLLKNVKANEALFRSLQDNSGDTSKYTLALNQIFVNKEMFLYIVAFIAAAIVVYYVRRMSADHAWGASVISGTVVQLIIVCGGEIALGNAVRIIPVFIGCLVSLFVSTGVMFMVRALDYSRVERVQFEDDEYYYYVKAVPKSSVALSDKQVKQIASKRNKDGRNSTPGKKVKRAHVYKKKHTSEGDSGLTEKDDLEKDTSLTEEQKALAQKAMEEFDVDGEWLE